MSNLQPEECGATQIWVEHYELIKESWDRIPGLTKEPDKMQFLTSSFYNKSKEEGLFSSGLDMSLWCIDGTVVTVTTSDENVLLVGSIYKNSERMDSFYTTIIGAPRLVPPITLIHNKNQEGLGELLSHWGTVWEKEKVGEILKEYSKLLGYEINGKKPGLKIWRDGDKRGDALLLLSFYALHLYLNANHAIEGDDTLIQWLYKNVIL